MTEGQIQLRLYNYLAYRLHHDHITPNSCTVFAWECDIISVTKSGYAQEFEIKRTLADYRADFNKKRKHKWLKANHGNIPSRFWYVINGFDLRPDDVPEYAGLIKIDGSGIWNAIDIKKRAPKLSGKKLEQRKINKLDETAYWRMWSLMEKLHNRDQLDLFIDQGAK